MTQKKHMIIIQLVYDECNSDNVLVLGKDWNKTEKTEIKIPDNYKYTYTYSVNLWDLEYDDIVHSHNFLIYIKK